MTAPRLTLKLLDGAHITQIDAIASLVAADASGQFGLQAGHENFATLLEPGLFRWRLGDQADWLYGACTGGLLSCMQRAGHTEIRIVSRRILQGAQPEALQTQLEAALEREHSLRLGSRASQIKLETALHKRMQELAETRP